MIPLTLAARNYGPYAEVTFDIPAGLTAVVGVNAVGEGADSNGSGKTKLLELLPIALFGPPAPWSEYLTVGSDETVCTVEMTFDHSGQTYRVRRTYDAKGRGKTTLDFENQMVIGNEHGPDVWDPLTMDSQTATQALLEKTIGIGEQSFAHSVFAAQGARHFADPSLPPRERKAILAEALGLAVWDELAKLVKADIASLQAEADAISAQLGAFEHDLAQKEELEAHHLVLTDAARDTDGDVAGAEVAEAKAREEHEALKTAADRLNALNATLRAAEQTLAGLERHAKDAADAQEEATACEDRIAELLPLANAADALEAEGQQLAVATATRQQALDARANLTTQAQQATLRRDKALAEQRQMRDKIALLNDDIDAIRAGKRHCDRCDQALTGDALLKAVASVDRDIAALDARLLELVGEVTQTEEEHDSAKAQSDGIVIPELLDAAALEAKRQALREARAAVSEVATLRERLLAAERTATAVRSDDFRSRVSAAEETVAGLGRKILRAEPGDASALFDAETEVQKATWALKEARDADREAQAALATSTERLRNLSALAQRSQEALAARAGLLGRLETLTALARSYGRDGIPALILEATAIPQLETEANRILTELGARFRFELVTQRENKGGGLKDTLDVMVHGEKGTLRYESYSGGEQTRLAFALRIALARLIASTRAAHAGILVLDELPFLDASGIASVCAVLRGLSEFRSVLLVSHDDRFVDAFDQVVTVVRDEAGSRLEMVA